jgi:general stress protein YciG
VQFLTGFFLLNLLPRRADVLELCLAASNNRPVNASEIARVLGRRGGKVRARVLSREERQEIAAKGGRARALSHHAERRVRENFRALEAVDALRNSRGR